MTTPTPRHGRRLGALLFCLALPAAQAQTIPVDLRLEPFIGGLSSPIGMTHAGDGSGRLFVNQQGGTVRVAQRSGQLLAAPFLQLSTQAPFNCTYPGNGAPTNVGFTAGGERGLLAVAFHPSFETNGRVFISVTDGRGDTLIARFTMANPADNVLSGADLSTCTVILRVDQDFGNHNGGDLKFGPDGFLYLALGDGGSGNDPCNRGQTLAPANLQGGASGGNADDCPADNSFLNHPAAGNGDPDSRALQGKFLRLDIDVSAQAPDPGLCGEPRQGQPVEYGIPPGQPGAAGGAIAQACDEVWTYGWRNPWRFSFDRQTGDLFIGDVGQGATEEISFQAAGVGGQNFGWDPCEGPFATGSTSTPCSLPGAVNPILSYGRSFGISITGGYRYRGRNFDLQPYYVYGDFGSGRIVFASQAPGGAWTPQEWTSSGQSNFNISSFGEDEDGQVYIVDFGGRVLRIGPDFRETVHRNSFE